jgi:hypothetical protein
VGGKNANKVAARASAEKQGNLVHTVSEKAALAWKEQTRGFRAVKGMTNSQSLRNDLDTDSASAHVTSQRFGSCKRCQRKKTRPATLW